jgi:phosphoribosylaminoimidazole-succinocarboxamide synthase
MSSTSQLHARGKVRDIYQAGRDLVLVATDRISAFDVILPTPIPDKGRVLTGLSLFWFDHTRELVGNHVLAAAPNDLPPPFTGDAELAGRSMLVKRADVIPLECVARGYLAGSGWKQYRETGAICGVPLRPGLLQSDRLDEPIFTPTTKATEGHDLPVDPDEGRALVGTGLFERLRELTIGLYERMAEASMQRGIILADTKLEFGFSDGELLLIDEVGTPDSSRFWPADGYRPGGPQPSFDKQFVRDWLERRGWDKQPPAPVLPPEIVEQTAGRYREAYERLTGESFAAYLRRMEVAPQ